MKSVLTPLAKNALLPFVLTEAMSARDAAIQKKIYGTSMAAVYAIEIYRIWKIPKFAANRRYFNTV